MKAKNYVQVFEGLRFVFEGPKYIIREANRDGYVWSDKGGEKKYFHIVNTICIPRDVHEYFNADGIGKQVITHCLFDDAEVAGIKFYTERCGF